MNFIEIFIRGGSKKPSVKIKCHLFNFKIRLLSNERSLAPQRQVLLRHNTFLFQTKNDAMQLSSLLVIVVPVFTYFYF